MVCLHHHPMPMGSRWLDGIGLANADEFWRIIDAHAARARRAFGDMSIRPTMVSVTRYVLRDALHRRAIPAPQRPLCSRLAAARLSSIRIARRWPYFHRSALDRFSGGDPRCRALDAVRTIFFALVCWAIALPSRADSTTHCLWELHGRHNTVYLLGSIHVLRPSDYPLAPAVLEAYTTRTVAGDGDQSAEMDSEGMQSEMLASAMLPEGKSLPDILGSRRYARATSLAHEVGVELSTFDQFAPWFAAEAISQLQLMQLGFEPQSGVEMYFLDRARADGKSVAGLETVHDQIALFESLSMDAQADYLISSLEQAHELPKEVGEMVTAWQHGDTAWFTAEMASRSLARTPRFINHCLPRATGNGYRRSKRC